MGPLFLYLGLVMEQETFFNTFPIEQFRRMVMHIDRFDPDVIEEETIKSVSAIDKMDALTEKLIEENL